MADKFKDSILSSCYNEIDYSDEFSKRINSFICKAEKEFNTSALQDEDMNYSSSQRILFFLNKECDFAPYKKEISSSELQKKSRYIVEILISSLGNYYWSRAIGKKRILWFTLNSGYTNTTSLPDSVLLKKKQIDLFFEKLGFISIPDKYLNDIVPGKFTNLDGKPATIFNRIFSEI